MGQLMAHSEADKNELHRRVGAYIPPPDAEIEITKYHYSRRASMSDHSDDEPTLLKFATFGMFNSHQKSQLSLVTQTKSIFELRPTQDYLKKVMTQPSVLRVLPRRADAFLYMITQIEVVGDTRIVREPTHPSSCKQVFDIPGDVICSQSVDMISSKARLE